MKNVFLSAIMVAVSFMATAQTINNPFHYNDASEANMYEWFTLSDSPGEVITYGDHETMESLIIDYLSFVKVDIDNPDNSFIDEIGDEYNVWVFVNQKHEIVKITVIKDSEYTQIIKKTSKS